MNTLYALYDAMSALVQGQRPSFLAGLPTELLERVTPSFTKDRIQFQRIAYALEAEDMAALPLSRFDAQAEATVKRFLETNRLGAVTNTLIKVRFVRDVAIAKGLVHPSPTIPSQPKRNRLTKTDETGQRILTRAKSRTAGPSYSTPLEAMPESLRDEILEFKHYATALVVRGRQGKAQRKTTWKANQDRLERFFGALDKMGHPIESASLRDFIQLSKLDVYSQFFLTFNAVPTYTLKDVYSLAQMMARKWFKDQAAADDIRSIISQTVFERQKDYDRMLQEVTADDLYYLADQVYDHALAYEQTWLEKKPCQAVRFPRAMVAYHYSRALLVHLWLATWLRKDNLFSIVYGTHLCHRNGQLWFAFTREEMKAGEPHTGQVRDLWRGQPMLERIERLLARYLELRPHLVARAQAERPDTPPAAQLILNKNGLAYSSNGSWYVFTSLSHAYLGPQKIVNPHAVRHIIPSYLVKKYDYGIMGEIQAMMAHRSILTTNTIYARTKQLFSAEGAQKRLDEARKQQLVADSVQSILMIVEKMEAKAKETVSTEEFRALQDELARMRALIVEMKAS